MSNISEENIGNLKVTACDKLLEARVDSKLSLGKLKDDVMSRITVAQPKARDGKQRGTSIPESVLAQSASMQVTGASSGAGGSSGSGRVTERQLEVE